MKTRNPPARTWEPCQRPKYARKASSRGFNGTPWFARGENYEMQIYRARGRTYARVSNTAKPKIIYNPVTNRTWRMRSAHGIQPEASQWYLITERV